MKSSIHASDGDLTDAELYDVNDTPDIPEADEASGRGPTTPAARSRSAIDAVMQARAEAVQSADSL